MGTGWLSVPKDWIASFGEIVKFCSRIVAEVFTLKVLRFFGEALRQAGILILSSTIVIWGLIFIIGLQCGIEGAYFNRSVGSPAYAGVFAAWCDLRELVPYAFGYMMSAKVGTGIVAELGSMRISDEIDALEVMGIPSLTFLCATKLLAAWLVLPFMYLAGIGAGFFASYLAVVQQIGEVSLRRVLPDLLDVPEPTRPLIQRDQGHDDGHRDRARRLLLRLQRERRAGRGGHRDREVDGAQHRARAPHRHAGHAALLGREPTRAHRRMNGDIDVSSDDTPAARPSRRPEARSRDGAARARGRSATQAPARRSPSASADPDDEYQWHTGAQRPTGVPDAVEFVEVHKAFGRNKILRGLNMGIPEGKISMILGPSGTGKSVCIKHMVGLLYPDEGDVLVHGESVPNMADDDLFEMRKKFGVLFQDGALFGSMNLFDNVCFPLRQHTDKGEDEIEEIVVRRLREVGLEGAHDKMPNELSGGMRKRAGFARALVLDPDIVLFDEPDSGLDPVRTALLCELIQEVHEENGGAYVVITHDIMSAKRVAEYIAVLWKGRIVESGPAEELFNSDNMFVRQFLSGASRGPLGME